ncbi:MAG: hypothetical protein ACR2KJ_16840 [Jatrophihabitans sp.]
MTALVMVAGCGAASRITVPKRRAAGPVFGSHAVPVPQPPPQPAAELAPCRIAGTTDDLDEGHDVDRSEFLPSRGTLRMVMVFVDFPDATAAKAPVAYRDPQRYYRDMVPGAEQWLSTVSRGALHLSVRLVSHWYRVDRTSKSYGFADGISYQEDIGYLSDVARVIGNSVRLGSYDAVYVVSVRGAVSMPGTATFRSGTPTTLPVSGGYLRHAATLGEDAAEDPSLTLAHETLHMLGLPDLYLYDSAADQFAPVGGWDIMSDPHGASPHLLGWELWKLGWITDVQVRCLHRGSTEPTQLSPIESPVGVTALVVPLGKGRAVVVESRRSIGVDAEACSSGVLIYRIDARKLSGNGPVRVLGTGVESNQLCQASTGPIDYATLGTDTGQVASYSDAADGIDVQLVPTNTGYDAVTVTVQ